ncbi:GNAT family N-acetyltransferase [Frateuria sp. STR12]|uniref:GNAT family N-acetyltransferase n=1 Tax=Frateuria hangzhouensis TaxID=2995589 RepID=UPI0022609663|nr:GNAT family protein [Frateuria sp. STR12]MCX7514834.1 GNAT family protein [Frateuria sp. STR12]
MELTTDRLQLDRLHPDDAAALYACRADPAVARFQGWRPGSVGEVRVFIDAQTEPVPGLWFQRAIRLREGHALIGDLGVCLPATPGDSVEFGISLAPAHQGNGYAREALQALFRQGFDVLGWRRIHASVDPRNNACVALLQALGMRQEAHFRESLWLHDEWVDDVVFAMLAREWQAA